MGLTRAEALHDWTPSMNGNKIGPSATLASEITPRMHCGLANGEADLARRASAVLREVFEMNVPDMARIGRGIFPAHSYVWPHSLSRVL